MKQFLLGLYATTYFLISTNQVMSEETVFTFTPSSLTAEFGNVTMLTGSSISVSNNKWAMQGGEITPIDMALKATIFAGGDCSINNFNMFFQAYHTSDEGDGAILIQAGSQYISFMFDFDGGVKIGGINIDRGGAAIYPSCGSSSLPNFPGNSTNIADLFDDSADTNSNNNNPFYNWRDRLAGGNRENWDIFNEADVGDHVGLAVSFSMNETDNKMNVTFTAGNPVAYTATCGFNTVFSFKYGKDVYVYFSPDYSEAEIWYIDNMTITTDCSAGAPTRSPTPPSLYPTSSPSQPPTSAPSQSPTDSPSRSPSLNPSQPPTNSPSQSPSSAPSISPTQTPSFSPTNFPSDAPSIVPTNFPTALPSYSPTNAPSVVPTLTPTNTPSAVPTSDPSSSPTLAPSIVPTLIPTNTPTVVPTTTPTSDPSSVPTSTPSLAPTNSPTFPEPYCNDYDTYYVEWDYLLQDDATSLSILNNDNDPDDIENSNVLWIKFYDYNKANNNNWLIEIESQFSGLFPIYSDIYDGNGHIGEFFVIFNLDLSNYPAFDTSSSKNPIFVITDEYYYVAIKIQDDGQIYVSGSVCDGSDSLPLVNQSWNITQSFVDLDGSQEGMDIDFTCAITSSDDNSTFFGFSNGYDYPLSIGVRSDVFYGTTKLLVSYFNENGELIEDNFIYNQLWDVNNTYYSTNMKAYVGSYIPSTDDYYRFQNVTLKHCSNEWDASKVFCEELKLNSSNLDWEFEGTDDVISLIIIQSELQEEIVHGWFDYNDTVSFYLDELPLWYEMQVKFRIFVANFTDIIADVFYANLSDVTLIDNLNIIVSHDNDYSTSGTEIIDVFNYQLKLPIDKNCWYSDTTVRSYWESGESTTGNDSLCYLDISFDATELENVTNYLHNVRFTVSINTTFETTGKWAFSNFCLNLSDITPSTSPTPAPTRDGTYTECVNSTLSSDDLSFNLEESENGDTSYLTITASTNYEITRNAKSYMKLGIQFNDNFAENRTNLAVLLADESRYTGLHLKLDEIEFTNDCGSGTLEQFKNDTNNSIVIPNMNDLTWYPHSSVVFRDPNVLSANEIDIEYYFDPLQETSVFKTFAFVERIHAGGVTVDSECGWYGNYKQNSDLSVYILVTNDTTYTSTTLIEEINIQYCTDNTNMFTTTRGPETVVTQLKSDTGNITTLPESCHGFNFTCLACFNSIEITDENEIYFGGFSTTLVNSEYGCACPVGVINSSWSSEEIVMIELNDGTNVYGKKIYPANSSYAVVSILFGGSESNCSLNYYVDYGSFANVSALNWLHVTFTLQNTIDLNTTQIGQLEYDYSSYFANVFNVSQNSSVVTINKTEIIDESDETRRIRRRYRRMRSRSLLQNSEWQYFNDLIIEAITADDASRFDLSAHFAELLSLFCLVSNDDECDYNNITNNDAASSYFSNITQEIASSASAFSVSDEEFSTTTTTAQILLSTTDENDNSNLSTSATELDTTVLVLLIVLLFCCIWACIWGVYSRKDKKQEMKEKKEVEMSDVHKRFQQKSAETIASGSATPRGASVDDAEIDFALEEDDSQGAPQQHTIPTTPGGTEIQVITYENSSRVGNANGNGTGTGGVDNGNGNVNTSDHDGEEYDPDDSILLMNAIDKLDPKNRVHRSVGESESDSENENRNENTNEKNINSNHDHGAAGNVTQKDGENGAGTKAGNAGAEMTEIQAREDVREDVNSVMNNRPPKHERENTFTVTGTVTGYNFADQELAMAALDTDGTDSDGDDVLHENNDKNITGEGPK